MEKSEQAIKILLQAAVFGRRFVEAPAALSKNFVKILGNLRICMQANKLQIPVSVAQLTRGGGVGALVAQMAARGLYVQATRIAIFAEVSPEPAFTRWGVQAIRAGSHLTDSELLTEISNKKEFASNLAPLAQEAAACRRSLLAAQIMGLEKVTDRRVQVLLSLGNFSDAAAEAAARADADILHACVFSISDESALADFSVNNPALLAAIRDVFLGGGRPRDFVKFLEKIPRAVFPLAQTAAWHALGTPAEDRADWLKFASDKYSESLAKDREHIRAGLLSFGAGALAGAAQLVKTQQGLEKVGKVKGVIGKSLFETIRKLLIFGEVAEAESLKVKFKIDDARYCRIMIRALSEGRQFDKLVDACTMNPPVCGFEPVIEALMVAGQNQLAGRFVSKLKDSKRQAELYEQLGRPEDAAIVIERAQANPQGFLSSITNVFSWGR